jgi:hypothetical protein
MQKPCPKPCPYPNNGRRTQWTFGFDLPWKMFSFGSWLFLPWCDHRDWYADTENFTVDVRGVRVLGITIIKYTLFGYRAGMIYERPLGK